MRLSEVDGQVQRVAEGQEGREPLRVGPKVEVRGVEGNVGGRGHVGHLRCEEG